MWDLLIVNPFTNVLLFIYELVGHNFGLAIIFFTILIRLLIWPLTAQQLGSSKKLQELQQSKEWKEINKKYAKDREKLAQAQMELYQKYGVNPFGSCLPTLIQFPLIIGLYQSIIYSLSATPLQLLELSNRVYPSLDVSRIFPLNSQFLWMDLGQPERLQIFGLAIPVLALLVALTTYLQSKLTMTSMGSSDNDQAAAMSQSMMLTMPIFLGWLALSFASGLALYFLVSNVFTIVQYAAMGRVDLKQLRGSRKA